MLSDSPEHAAFEWFNGPLNDTLPVWLKHRSYRQILPIADSNTLIYCWPLLQKVAQDAAWLPPVVVPAGEQYKNMAGCQHIWEAMLHARLDRKALVVNLGGGVIGDMGGFCAATWKRGIDFIQIPTTLLSMTDAAIGGKLGVDFQQVKNIIGVFQQPAAVFTDPVFLKTLPVRELLSGFAEVIKHALIGAPALWQMIAEKHMEGGLRYDSFDWPGLLEASTAIKMEVVRQDPHEKGLRMVLNYGHTIGHAVESYLLDSPAPVTHGEAIAYGMLAESRLAYPPGRRLEAIEAVLRRYFPPLHVPPDAFPLLWETMLQDKKNEQGKVRMTVPGNTPFSYEIHQIGWPLHLP
jgi:3-dehydroquinate synthase